MEEVLTSFRQFVSGLQDDICVFADTIKELDSHLHQIFPRFEEYSHILNTSKCRFFVTERISPSFRISKDGIAADPARLAAVRERPMPSTTSKIRAFFNVARYFRNLIDRFSDLSAPLTSLSSGPKNAQISLTPDAHLAWLKTKSALTTTPVIRKFNCRLPVIIESDASKYAIGAALLQPHLTPNFTNSNSSLHSVSFFSKKLTEAQIKYADQEREILGIMLALQYWRHWVGDSVVTVVTDHESLKTIRTKVKQPARIFRFLDAIEHYRIQIVYRQGKANLLADYLSRPTEVSNCSGETLPPSSADRQHQIRRLERLNRIDLQSLYEFLSLGNSLPSQLTEQWARANFTVLNPKLHRIYHFTPTPLGDPPCLPGAIILQEVLEYDELVDLLSQTYKSQGHASISTTT
ncbi:hypothetical protein K3495_g15311 [Podosphaera aphanis]|nr:hypothetical protein K3495_g15311 [Podosphaera aphanis]